MIVTKSKSAHVFVCTVCKHKRFCRMEGCKGDCIKMCATCIRLGRWRELMKDTGEQDDDD